jgi:hypothetical protein
MISELGLVYFLVKTPPKKVVKVCWPPSVSLFGWDIREHLSEPQAHVNLRVIFQILPPGQPAPQAAAFETKNGKVRPIFPIRICSMVICRRMNTKLPYLDLQDIIGIQQI